MKNVLLVVSMLCAMSLFSCNDKDIDTNKVLLTLEQLMETNPDSALKALEEIENIEDLTAENEALYSILLTQAKDKNFIKKTSDNLINKAVRYYEKRKDLKRKAQAFYFAGRVYKDLNDADKALEYYLKANELAEKTNEYKLRGLIKYYIGDIYSYTGSLNEVLMWSKRSAPEFYSAGDMESYISALNNIGYIYTKRGELDSADHYLNKALDLSIKYKYKYVSGIQNALAILYQKKENYPLSVSYAISSLKNNLLEDKKFPCSLVLGESYYRMGNADSAKVYLEEALGGILHTKVKANRILAKISHEKNDYASEVNYLNNYILCQDSIESRYNKTRIKELELKYDSEKIKNENYRLNQEKYYLWLGINILFLTILSIYLFFKDRISRKKIEFKELEEYVGKIQLDYVAIEKEKQAKEAEIERLRTVMSGKEESLRDDSLQKETSDLQNTIAILQESLQQLSKKSAYLMKQLLKGHTIMKTVGEAATNVTEQKMTEELWSGIKKEINVLDAGFLKNLSKSAPDMKERELQLCCLIKLNVPLDQIAALLQVDKKTISCYKSEIVKKCFNRTDKILLDTLIRMQ